MSGDKTVITKAVEARKNSYSPYSGFRVGAALRSRNGEIYIGTNVESSSYGLTVCAERNAIASALVQGEREFDLLIVSSEKGVAPCGACRQVISDVCGDIEILLVDETGTVRTQTRTSELLPLAFGHEDLNK